MNNSSMTLSPELLSPASSIEEKFQERSIDIPRSVESITFETLESKAATSESPAVSESLENQIKILKEACSSSDGEVRRVFTDRFMLLIHEAQFEFGLSTPADEHVIEALNTYGTFARDWISHLYVENFEDPFVTCAILRVIAHLEYDQMSPQGMIIAAAAGTHADMGVRECCIRCFENWEHRAGLKILKSLTFPEDWLNDYLRDVISDLQELSEYAASC